jgi:hypothetical protein
MAFNPESFDTGSFDSNSFDFGALAQDRGPRMRAFLAEGLQNEPKTVIDPRFGNQQLAAKRKQMMLAQLLQQIGQQGQQGAMHPSPGWGA